MKKLAFISVLALAAGANAQIIGGSSLINNADLNTLSGWLGQGPLQITNIFDHVMGDGKDAVAFHGAADAQGPTFSILRDENTGQIFGGYNPNSWNSVEGWHYTYTDPEKTAFLFNLTTNTKYAQNTGGNTGDIFQSYNASNYGPTFGGGHDLYVPNDLTNGYAYAYTYGNNVINNGGTGTFVSTNLTELEVFTITQAPTPGAAALLGMGGVFAARRRRN